MARAWAQDDFVSHHHTERASRRVRCGAGASSYLLPPPNDLAVPHQPRPSQSLDLPAHAGYLSLRAMAEQLGGAGGEGLALRDQVPTNQAEDAIGQQIRADVQVASVPGAEGQCLLGEAVGGHVCVGGGQEGALRGREGA